MAILLGLGAPALAWLAPAAHAAAAYSPDAAVQVLPTDATATVRLALESRDGDPVFDGIGGLVNSAALLYHYPEPQRSQILDYLFKPGVGQALQILKLEIGGDTNSTVGAESAYRHAEQGPANVFNGYEAWMAVEAHKRNPKIKLWGLQWGAPAWVGAICSKRDAQYLADWVKLMRSQAGLRVDYLSAGQNEAPCVPDPATGSLDDQATIRTLRATLDANGLNAVKVIGYDGFDMPAAAKLQPATLRSLYAVGVHYPGGWQKPLLWSQPDPKAAGYEQAGVKYWTSEDTDFQATNPPGTLTRQYNFRFLQSGGHLVVNWSPIGATYATYDFLEHADTRHFPARKPQMTLYAMEPWSGHYELVQAPFWSLAHTTQFTEAGWRYVASVSRRLGEHGGSVVAYRSGHGSDQDWTVTLETTDATQPQTVRLAPGSQLSHRPITIFTSNDTRKIYFHKLGTFKPGPDGIALRVAPHSLVTVSTRDGHKDETYRSAPPSAPFPAHYQETFADYAPGTSMIRYLAPQQGAYEVQACRDRKGQCLTQMAPAMPIRWNDPAKPEPYALVGDPHATDGTVQADVLLPGYAQTDYVGIGARARFHNLHFEGYRFIVRGDGHWTLDRVLTKGRVDILRHGNVDASGTWHRLALRFRSDKATASIDGAVVATLDATDPSAGQAAIVSGYGKAQYGNLEVTRAADEGDGRRGKSSARRRRDQPR